MSCEFVVQPPSVVSRCEDQRDAVVNLTARRNKVLSPTHTTILQSSSLADDLAEWHPLLAVKLD
jgi:hypothetical protein